MHSQCQFFHSFSVIFFSQASDINFTPVSPNRKFRFLASLCTKVYEKGDMHFENWELNVGKRTKNSIRKFKQFCCQKGVDKKARRQHKTNANLVSKFWQPCRHSLWNPHQKDRCSDVCVWQSHPPGSGVAGVHVRGLLGCWGGGDWEGSLPEKCLPAPFALPAGSLSTVPFAAGGGRPRLARRHAPVPRRVSPLPLAFLQRNAVLCTSPSDRRRPWFAQRGGLSKAPPPPLRCPGSIPPSRGVQWQGPVLLATMWAPSRWVQFAMGKGWEKGKPWLSHSPSQLCGRAGWGHCCVVWCRESVRAVCTHHHRSPQRLALGQGVGCTPQISQMHNDLVPSLHVWVNSQKIF